MRFVLAAAALLAASPALAQDMAVGDASAGEKVFRKCKACHVADEAQNKVGPHLMGLFGRTAGELEDYRYSSAMTEAGESGLVWTHESLGAYLEAPRKYVPGTKMAFAGLRKEEDIADVIAYLEQYDEDGQPEDVESTYTPPGS